MTVLPTVRAQLLDAVDRRAQPSAHTRHRLTPGRVVTAALVAVPVVIAAIAFVVLGDHRSAPTSRPAAHPGTARQQLIDHFGVFRRAQTAADRGSQLLVPPFLPFTAGQRRHPDPGVVQALKRWGDPKLDRTLMRVIPVPELDAKVALEPLTWQPSPSSPRRSEGLELVLWIGNASTIPPSSEEGTGPTSVSTVLTHGLALADGALNRSVIDGVVAVPDGVATVTIRPIRLLRTPVPVDPSTLGAATATVHNNVAAYRLPLPTVQSTRFRGSSLFGTSALADVTWFAADGKVIKRTTTRLTMFVRFVGRRAQTTAGGTSSR